RSSIKPGADNRRRCRAACATPAPTSSSPLMVTGRTTPPSFLRCSKRWRRGRPTSALLQASASAVRRAASRSSNRVSPTACATLCCATAPATPVAGSRRSGAISFWRCLTSTDCTDFFRRWCGAKATTSAMWTWPIGRAGSARRTTACGIGFGSGFSISSGSGGSFAAGVACRTSWWGNGMLVDLSKAGRSYLHEVCVVKFQWWVLLGYLAQVMFTMRFVVQWIASERAGKMVMPIAFWFFSIGGGVLLLLYALYIRDPVFILGQGFGVFVYA